MEIAKVEIAKLVRKSQLDMNLYIIYNIDDSATGGNLSEGSHNKK